MGREEDKPNSKHLRKEAGETMPNIITVSQHLPANIEDLAKFVLVGREKLVAVRAEIRAIDKLNIAEEVRVQKREEAQMLSGALLDAEVRIGELLKQLQKADKGNQYTGKMVRDTTVHNQKPKLEVVQDLGFSPKQAQRFETLANNKDIVEQVKAEAKENEDIPTRSRVLQLVKEKNKPIKPDIDPDFRYHATRSINEAIGQASTVQVNPDRLACWLGSLKDQEEQNFQLLMIDDAIQNLQIIKAYLTKQKGR